MKSTFVIYAFFTVIQLLRAAEEPQELTNLRESYQRARERAIAPLQAKYVSGLEALKLRMTKSGKLEDALAVDAELKAITEKADQSKPEGVKPENTPLHLIGDWYCNGNEADVYFIKRHKKAQHRGTIGEWKYEDGLLTITWQNGFRLTIDAEQKGDVIVAKNYPPGATRFGVMQLTRK